jgi:hypothetical protein
MLVAAAPLARPNVFGEQFSVVAAGLCFGAALVALIGDKGRINVLERSARPLRSVVLWLFLAYVWLAATAGDEGIRPVLQSVVLTVGTTAAVIVVLADQRRARITAKFFLILLLGFAASWAVTANLWLLGGVGTGRILQFTLPGSFTQTIYFPCTLTTGYTQLSGMTLPRFSGLGREAGWMAMYLAFAFFLLPRVGWRKTKWRLLCVLGIAGTVSTAGFGVFVVVLAFEWFLRTRPVSSLLVDYLRRLSGVWLLAGAAWLAVYAPVVGLAAKRQMNEISLSERSAATAAGWHALWNTPLGGDAADRIGGVNLIASIAAAGLPFVICVIAALLSPRIWHQARPLSSAPIMVLLLTLATSQPAKDSTWVFVAAAMAYAATSAPANAEVDAEIGSTASTRSSQIRAKELGGPQLSAVGTSAKQTSSEAVV